MEAARSAARDWTAVDRGDGRFFIWREFICDVLRAARITLPAETLAFTFTEPPPAFEGALAARVDLLHLLNLLHRLEALAAAQGMGSM